MTKKEDEAQAKALAEKVEVLVQERMSNRDKRHIVKVFEADLDNLDEGDFTVVIAWLASNKENPLEHYDAMPVGELTKIVEAWVDEE